MPPLYLASLSSARRKLLDSAGISYEAHGPRCDEEALKEELVQAQKSLGESAKTLAFEKAKSVSVLHKNVLCLGGDQICGLSGQWLNKPKSLKEAFEQLSLVSGKIVTYTTALSLCEKGQEVWSHVETTELRYRCLSFAQKKWYTEERSEASFCQEGLFLVEGVGIQLVAEINGSYSGLLGLPVLPLIGELQRRHLLEH